MKRIQEHFIYKSIVVFLLFTLAEHTLFAQDCDNNTPSFTVDLTGNPDSAWTSPSVRRKGSCCGIKGSDQCVEFIVTLDDDTESIRFDVADGAEPNGSLGWSIDCGPENPVGTPLCVSGTGPHKITFCKPGGNENQYTITAIAKPSVSDPTVVSDGCTAELSAEGFEPGSVQWESVPSDPDLEALLSCTNCLNPTATRQPGTPTEVEYQVTGTPEGGCDNTQTTVGTTVYFVDDKDAEIVPQDPVVCFGGVAASVTANAVGGAPPYEYEWNTGETSQSIDVGPGTYTVEITDSTSCPPAYDTVEVTAQLSPVTALAGDDIVSCANNPEGQLDGAVVEAGGGIWSGGDGVYDPSPDDLNATYTPTADEIDAGEVEHILTTTDNGGCPEEYDTVRQEILPAPEVTPGGPLTTCANNASVDLDGQIEHAGGGVWSGDGVFYPNPSTLDARYEPTADEIAAGTATLTLTSTDNGTCNAVSEQLDITILPAPVVDAGTDPERCANNASVALDGTVTNAGEGVWSGGNGTFSDVDPSAASATYMPTADEIDAGSVELILSSADNGLCRAVRDTLEFTIYPAPVVDAGDDGTICDNNPFVTATGFVDGTDDYTWSTSGSGDFEPRTDTIEVTYNASEDDADNGGFSLYLTSAAVDGCLPVQDTVNYTLLEGPVADAGNDRFVCANNATLNLNGQIEGATGGVWSNGGGDYTNTDEPNANVTYTPSQQEREDNVASLILESTGNGLCNAARDTMLVIITDAQEADAGPDQEVCENDPDVQLNGTSVRENLTFWSSPTGGTFSPDQMAADAVYTPSADDVDNGSVSLVYTVTRSGCINETDTMEVVIDPRPEVDAGPDQVVCGNNATINLDGTVTGAPSAEWLGGDGVFSPGREDVNASYDPSADEIENGSVTLILSSQDSPTCLPEYDTVQFTITPAPTVDVTTDAPVCANKATVTLDGTFTIATGVTYSGGGGAFNPNKDQINTSYTPSPAERQAGEATLVASTTGNGDCLPATQNISIPITPAPEVDAGPDVEVCANFPTATLEGEVTVADGGRWTNGTGSFNPDRDSLSGTYTLSPDELDAEAVTLYLTSTGNGNCNPVTDTLNVSVTPAPTVNAGPVQVICEDANDVLMDGTVTGAGGAVWSATGNGAFSSADTANADARYQPTDDDIAADTLDMYLTSVDNGLCLAVQDTTQLVFNTLPSIDLGPDRLICTNVFPVTLEAEGASGQWQGYDGELSPSDTVMTVEYTPSADEVDQGEATLEFVTEPNGSCSSVSDQITVSIEPGPEVNTTADTTICADVSGLDISAVYQHAGGVNWSTTGQGTFDDASSASTFYNFAPEDTANRSVTLIVETVDFAPCAEPDTDTMHVTILPAPTISAGPDLTICADQEDVEVRGSEAHTGGVVWSTDGSGSFDDDTLTTIYYTPSADDTTAGSVTLSVQSTATGICQQVEDEMELSINPAPVVDAGTDETVCADTAYINLDGQVSNANGGFWSTIGTGSFSPDPGDLSTTYIPSAEDTAAGSVQLVLESTGNGLCNAVTDTVTHTILPAPYVTTADSIIVCADTGAVELDANPTHASGGVWSTNGSGTFSDADTANAQVTYQPSAADTANGQVQLTVTTTGNGLCKAVTNTTELLITPAPEVDAGPDQTHCSDITTLALDGRVTHAGGGLWESQTGGDIDDPTDPQSVYTPSQAEKDSGRAELVFTTTDNGYCRPVSDTLNITLTPAPEADAGEPFDVCADTSFFELSGTVEVAGGGRWHTSGSGSFAPNQATLETEYSPSAADTTAGTVQFVLETTSNGTCRPVTDTVDVIINPIPVINVPDTVFICADVPEATITADVRHAGGVAWSAADGNFSDTTALTTTFTPSDFQIEDGKALISVTSTDNDLCRPVTEQVVVSIAPAPEVDAGEDMTYCGDIESVNLNGTVTNAGGGFWTADGTGSFVNDSTQLDNEYQLSSQDKARGEVIFTLASTENGYCRPVTDEVNVTLTPVPVVTIAQDTACGDRSGVPVEGTVSGASSTGAWSTSGTGTFTPNNTSLSATYMPSSDDIDNGSVTVTLDATGIGSCLPVSRTMNIDLIPQQEVDAGFDKIVCANNAEVSLNGSSDNLLGGIRWSTPGSGNYDDETSLSTTYTPTAADKGNGGTQLVLQSTNNGLCPQARDTLMLTITPAPTISTTDQTICADQDSVQMEGNITVASGGIWQTTGTGTFEDQASLNGAHYYPGEEDVDNGGVDLVVVSFGNGTCLPVTDTMRLTITPAPTADIGNGQRACSNTEGIRFLADVTVATGGDWTTSGTGSFSNLDTEGLNVRYALSNDDQTADSLEFYFESTGNGTCQPVRDTAVYYFDQLPIVETGDAVACADADGVELDGEVTVDGDPIQGRWSTDGTGTFDPNDTTINATYMPSADDINAGQVTLSLQSLNEDACAQVISELQLDINPAPKADAGSDVVVCADTAGVELDGTVTNAGGGVWRSSGSGSFSMEDEPNAFAVYQPSAADIDSGMVSLTLETTDNGICDADQDELQLTITPAPQVEASVDVNCTALGDSIQVYGQVDVATAWEWNTSGTGVFDDPNALNPVYIPSADDFNNGSVDLSITSTNQGDCKSVADTITVNFITPPEVDAGSDMTVCADTVGVDLDGTYSDAGGAVWQTVGNGTFSNEDQVQGTATYLPGGDDIDSGSVALVLSSVGNGICDAATDTMLLTITPAPEVDISGNPVCAAGPDVPLEADVTVATEVSWSSSGTGDFDDSTNFTPVYTMSTDDENEDDLTFTITTTAQGQCKPVSESVTINTLPPPEAVIGSDTLPVCADTAGVALAGTVNNAGEGVWSSGGSGTLTNEDPANASAVYQLSPEDIDSGYVSLLLVTQDNGLCHADTAEAVLQVAPAPIINAGDDEMICADYADIELDGSIENAGGAVWDVISGDGTLSNEDTASAYAAYDITTTDTTAGMLTFRLRSVQDGLCKTVTDTLEVTIAPQPVVDAGVAAICSTQPSVNLNGLVTNAGGGQWQSSGSGVFSPDESVVSGSRYIHSDQDIEDGSVMLTLTSTDNGTCQPVSDSLLVTIAPRPEASTSSDQTRCADEEEITLSGQVRHAGGGEWSTSGAGSFVQDDTTLSGLRYQIDPADTTAGSIMFYLTTTNNQNCLPARDSMEVTFTPAPTINAGGDESICADSLRVGLSAQYSVASEVRWSTSGSGSFSPSDFADNPVYLASDDDAAQGTIWLNVETTEIGSCNKAVEDSVELTINPAPSADAGPDVTICKSENEIQLDGTVQVAGGGVWSASGNGGFSAVDSSASTANYQLTSADKNNEEVSFRLTSVMNGNCRQVTDIMNVQLQKVPVVNAGSDLAFCQDVDSVSLNGNVEHAGGGFWTTSGQGVFDPDTTTLNAKYRLDGNDFSPGDITFTLHSLDNGVCPQVTDDMTLDVTPAPEVNAGDDIMACADTTGIELDGQATISSSVEWSTSGDGNFFNTPTAFDATYVPGSGDENDGELSLYLTTTDNGTCLPRTDTLEVNIRPVPVVDVGEPVTICADQEVLDVSASLQHATGGTWSASGTGVFTNDTAQATVYEIAPEDRQSGFVRVRFEATEDIEMCRPVTDRFDLTINPAPVVDAGNDKMICADAPNIDVRGQLQVATEGRWSTQGTGTFANRDALSTVYHASSADLEQGSVQLVLTSMDNGLCEPVRDTVEITIVPAPTVSVGNTNICAFDEGLRLNGSVTRAGGVEWSTSGEGSFAPNKRFLQPDYFPSGTDYDEGIVSIQVTTTDNGLCQPVSDEANILITPLPRVNAGNEQIVCRGTPTSLQGFSPDEVNYLWTSESGDTISREVAADIVADVDTFYVLQVEDVRGCLNDDTVKVIPVDPPEFDLQEQYCYDDGFPVDAQPDVVPDEGRFQWFRNDTLLAGTNPNRLMVYETGQHRITYTYGLCSHSDSTEVTPLPLVNPEDKIICENTTTSLVASEMISGGSYEWVTADTVAGTSDTLEVTVPEDQHFWLTITDSLGCANTDSLLVETIPPPQLTLEDTAGCEGDAVMLEGQPSNLNEPTAIYTWSRSQDEIQSGAESILSVNDEGLYNLLYEVGECRARDSAEVTFNPKPEPENRDEVLFCREDEVSVDVDAGPGEDYLWLADSSDNRIFEVFEAGFYHVQVYNQFRCFTLDSIKVRDVCEPEVYVPTAFAPRGNTGDEEFKVFGKYYRDVEITIFNRWGEIIYYSEDKNEGWDGTYRGEMMPMGVYPYVLKYKGDSPEYEGPYEKTGKVTLIR